MSSRMLDLVLILVFLWLWLLLEAFRRGTKRSKRSQWSPHSMRRSRPRRVCKVQLRSWSHVASRRYSGTANLLLEVSHPSPKFKDDPLFFFLFSPPQSAVVKYFSVKNNNNNIITFLVHNIFCLYFRSLPC